jgi:hypothetical protein
MGNGLHSCKVTPVARSAEGLGALARMRDATTTSKSGYPHGGKFWASHHRLDDSAESDRYQLRRVEA